MRGRTTRRRAARRRRARAIRIFVAGRRRLTIRRRRWHRIRRLRRHGRRSRSTGSTRRAGICRRRGFAGHVAIARRSRSWRRRLRPGSAGQYGAGRYQTEMQSFHEYSMLLCSDGKHGPAARMAAGVKLSYEGRNRCGARRATPDSRAWTSRACEGIDALTTLSFNAAQRFRN
jgi:hypothetical protein